MSRMKFAIRPVPLIAALALIPNCVTAKDLVVARSVGAITTPDISRAAAGSGEILQLQPGTQVEGLREIADPKVPGLMWTEVRTADGRSGWIQSNSLSDTSVSSRTKKTNSRESSNGKSAPTYLINNQGSAARLVSTPNFQNTGGDVALLPRGTKVKGLETRPDPALSFLEWHQVEVTEGSHKGKKGWVSVGVLESTQERVATATHSIDNDGSAARVVSTPSFQAAANFSDDVATVARGTPVKVTESRADPALTILRWSRVQILAGPHKGKSGWVSSNVLRERPKTARTVEVRFRSFIPAPMVGFGGESVLNPLLGNLVFGGDNRGFGYGKAGYRSHQNAVVTLDRDAKTPLIDSTRDWGVSRTYFARQAVHVRGRPIWWLGPKGQQSPISIDRLQVRDSNSSISVRRDSGNTVVVHLRLSGGNPGEPMTSILGKIDADLKVYLRESDSGDLEYRFNIQHDGFPAYELYIDGDEVYTHDPVAQKQHPLSLIGTGSGEFSESSRWEVLPE